LRGAAEAERAFVSGEGNASSYLDSKSVNEIRRGCWFPIRRHLKRESWFFAIQIEEYFEFCPEWYREQRAAALVGQYYVLLRSVLRTRPLLRRCLVRCRHCRIFFLTHPCNGGRKDLGCPFGCSRAHRKQQSTVRSVAYYRDAIGKKKKQALNGKRAKPKTGGIAPQLARLSLESGSGRWDPLMLEYVRMLVSLIEARSVSRAEILEMLQRVLRQHSLGRRRKIDHAVIWLQEHPP
jgi:hypothetical protein